MPRMGGEAVKARDMETAYWLSPGTIAYWEQRIKTLEWERCATAQGFGDSEAINRELEEAYASRNAVEVKPCPSL